MVVFIPQWHSWVVHSEITESKTSKYFSLSLFIGKCFPCVFWINTSRSTHIWKCCPKDTGMPQNTKLLTTGIWSARSGFPAQISWQLPFPRSSASFLINLCKAEGNFCTLKHYASESMLKYHTVQIRGFSPFSATSVTLDFTSKKISWFLEW